MLTRVEPYGMFILVGLIVFAIMAKSDLVSLAVVAFFAVCIVITILEFLF